MADDDVELRLGLSAYLFKPIYMGLVTTPAASPCSRADLTWQVFRPGRRWASTAMAGPPKKSRLVEGMTSIGKDAGPTSLGPPDTGRMKGSAFVGVVKGLRALKEAGRKVTPPELQHYLSTRILAGSWYDERDVVALMAALAKVWRPPGGGDPWDALGRVGAEEYYTKYYRLLFREGDPLGTLGHYPSQWSLRHDTGTMTVTAQGKGQARIELTGYRPAAPEYCRAVGGTIAGLVQCSGGQDVVARKVQCVYHREPLCAWLVSWTAGP